MNSAIEQRKGRTLVGTVISDKSDKTIVVRVETLVQHPLLKKYVRRRPEWSASFRAGPRRAGNAG